MNDNEIREIVRDELRKLLDRGNEIQTTNDRLWLMRNEAHREIDLLHEQQTSTRRFIDHLEQRNDHLNITNAELYAQLDKLTREIRDDQAALALALERLSYHLPHHTAAYEAVRARIRDV